jgi:4-hydroxybenzoyl-CoA thioesterase/acyl-CoA thioester hydrolase
MFSLQRRVEFRDTDAAGIVHFSAFFPMMESAEHEALRSLGVSVMQPIDGGGHLTWPRVSAKCDYLSAARFEDLLTISVSVRQLGTTSVTYGIEFSREGSAIAKGEITAVCCVWMPGEPLKKTAIPAELRSKLTTLM